MREQMALDFLTLKTRCLGSNLLRQTEGDTVQNGQQLSMYINATSIHKNNTLKG
jgi:hypothetical protein